MTVSTLQLPIPGSSVAKPLRAKTVATLTDSSRTSGAKVSAPREFRAELGASLREGASGRGRGVDRSASRNAPNASLISGESHDGDVPPDEDQGTTLDRATGEGERMEAPPDHPSRAQDQSPGSEGASQEAEADETVERGDAATQPAVSPAKAEASPAEAGGEPTPTNDRGDAVDQGHVVAAPVDPTGGTPLTIRQLNRALRGLDRGATPATVLRDLGLAPGGSGAVGVESAGADGGDVLAPDGVPPAETATASDRRSEEQPQTDQPRSDDDGDDTAIKTPSSERSTPGEPAVAGLTRPISETTAASVRDAAGTEVRATTASTTTAPAAPVAGHTIRSGHDRAGVFTSSSPMLLRHSHDAEGLEAQVARGLAAALGQRGAAGSGAVTLRLSPESLGPLRIELDVQGASVTVRFVAQSVGVAERIDRAMPILRATLDAAGLELRGATTRVNAEGRSDGGLHDQGRGDAGGARSGAAAHDARSNDAGTEPHNSGSSHAGAGGEGVGRAERSAKPMDDPEAVAGLSHVEPVRIRDEGGVVVLGVDTLA